MAYDENSVYHVFSGGEYVCTINQFLLKKQGVDSTGLSNIKALHVKKHLIFQHMENTPVECTATLKKLADEVTEVEFALQRAWGFPQDKTYHEWYNVPKCNCSKLDNKERRGTPYSIVNLECPIHGYEKGIAND